MSTTQLNISFEGFVIAVSLLIILFSVFAYRAWTRRNAVENAPLDETYIKEEIGKMLEEIPTSGLTSEEILKKLVREHGSLYKEKYSQLIEQEVNSRLDEYGDLVLYYVLNKTIISKRR